MRKRKFFFKKNDKITKVGVENFSNAKSKKQSTKRATESLPLFLLSLSLFC